MVVYDVPVSVEIQTFAWVFFEFVLFLNTSVYP